MASPSPRVKALRVCQKITVPDWLGQPQTVGQAILPEDALFSASSRLESRLAAMNGRPTEWCGYFRVDHRAILITRRAGLRNLEAARVD